MKKCPFCAEEIQDEAVKCRFCKEWIKPSSNEAAVSDKDMLHETHGGETKEEQDNAQMNEELGKVLEAHLKSLNSTDGDRVAVMKKLSEKAMNAGVLFTHRGMLDEAIEEFIKVIKVDPNHIDAYYGRAVAYFNKRSYDLSAADYRKVVDIDPDCSKAYLVRGMMKAIHGGDFDEGMAELDQAIELDPGDAHIYYNRGIAYSKQGHVDQAILNFTRAVEIAPDFADAYNSRGFVYFKQNNYDQALSDWAKTLEINPRCADTYNNRGVVYCSQKRYDESWEDIHKAEALGIKIDPEFLKDLKKKSKRDR